VLAVAKPLTITSRPLVAQDGTSPCKDQSDEQVAIGCVGGSD
jgi:hypothetical protein